MSNCKKGCSNFFEKSHLMYYMYDDVRRAMTDDELNKIILLASLDLGSDIAKSEAVL